MRKTILFALLGMLAAGAARAEELVIRLQSGNAVVIQYTGAVQGVTLNGETDAIAGLDMPAATHDAPDDRHITIAKQASRPEPEKTDGGNQEGRWLRLKWADPIDDAQ